MLFLTMILPLVQVPSTWFLHRRYSDFLTLRATLIKVVIITIIFFIVIIIIFNINIFTVIIIVFTKTRIRSLQVWPRGSRFPQRDGSDPTLSPPFLAGGLLAFRSGHLDDEDDVDADAGDVDDVDADDGDGSGNSGFPGHSDGGCGDEEKSGPRKLSLPRSTENCRGFSSPSPISSPI